MDENKYPFAVDCWVVGVSEEAGWFITPVLGADAE